MSHPFLVGWNFPVLRLPLHSHDPIEPLIGCLGRVVGKHRGESAGRRHGCSQVDPGGIAVITLVLHLVAPTGLALPIRPGLKEDVSSMSLSRGEFNIRLTDPTLSVVSAP